MILLKMIYYFIALKFGILLSCYIFENLVPFFSYVFISCYFPGCFQRGRGRGTCTIQNVYGHQPSWSKRDEDVALNYHFSQRTVINCTNNNSPVAKIVLVSSEQKRALVGGGRGKLMTGFCHLKICSSLIQT